MSNPRIIQGPFYHGHPIQTFPDGYHSNILDRNEQLLNAAGDLFRRFAVLRVCLKFPQYQQYPHDNRLIRLFMEDFALDRRTAGYDILYAWVWEKNDSDNHHYHCVFCFNSSQTQNFQGHMAAAKMRWAKILQIHSADGLVHYGDLEHNTFKLNVNDPNYAAAYDRCYEALSYEAKVDTKQQIPAGVRKLGSSRLPRS